MAAYSTARTLKRQKPVRIAAARPTPHGAGEKRGNDFNRQLAEKVSELEIERQDGADEKTDRQDMGCVNEHVECSGAPERDRRRGG